MGTWGINCLFCTDVWKNVMSWLDKGTVGLDMKNIFYKEETW